MSTVWRRIKLGEQTHYRVEFYVNVTPYRSDVAGKNHIKMLYKTVDGNIEALHTSVAKAKRDGEARLKLFLERTVKKFGGEIVWKPWRP